jgi:hypothetical protein
MNRARARIAIVAIPLLGFGVGLGCEGQVDRTYFNDLFDGSVDATTNPIDAHDVPDTSTMDGPLGDEHIDGPDAMDAADGGGGMADGVADSPAEAAEASVDAAPDCGPTNTVTNCGQCGAACDTTHSTPSSCTAGACHYTCATGWGDCQSSAPDLNGCETPLNTTSNCTACGVACDTAHSLDAGCSATGCTYSGCAAGYLDCHTTAPNADGCECNAPSCCEGGVCEPLHDNGVGQSYYDCEPVGTYSASLALKACTAYTGSASLCVSYPCTPSSLGPIICSALAVSPKVCMCWSYGGSNVGQVDNGGGSGASNCFCPQADPPWN